MFSQAISYRKDERLCYADYLAECRRRLGPYGLEEPPPVLVQSSEAQAVVHPSGGRTKPAKKRKLKVEKAKKQPANASDKLELAREVVPREQRAFLPYTIYTQHSTLSALEHKHYVAMMLQRASGAAFRHKQEDKEKLEMINKKLADEREKFNEEVRQSTLTYGPSRYWYLPKAVQRFVQESFRAKLQWLANFVPCSYNFKAKFPISSDPSGRPVMEYSSHLVVLGHAPTITLPSLKRKAVVPFHDATTLENCVEQMLQNWPLTEDPNVSLLLERHSVDFVSGASAIRSILADCGPMYSANYNVPIVVKSKRVEGRLKRVVFFLKPIMSSPLTAIQQNVYAAKHSLRSILLSKTTESAEITGDENILGPQPTGLDENVTQPSGDTLNAGDSSTKTADQQLPTTSTSVEKAARKKKMKDRMEEIMSNLPGYRNVSVGLEKKAKSCRAVEDVSDFFPPVQEDKQLCYDLWTLKGHSLLVRFNSEGLLARQAANGQEVISKCTLRPKVELQPEHGGEVLRFDELRTAYWNAFLKRSNHNCIARIHYKLQQILAFDQGPPSSLLSKDFYTANHEWISEGFGRLHKIFQALSTLDEGKYLLSVTGAEKKFVSLYAEASEGQGAEIDLSNATQLAVAKAKCLAADCWLRIDPNTILQWHVIRKHAPASFDPKETPFGVTPLRTNKQKPPGNKQKQKKKKKNFFKKQ